MRFLLLFLLAFLAACDNSETITAPDKKDTVATVASGINLSGKVNLSNAGGLDASSISVSVAGIVVHPKDDGSWTLTGSVPSVAARASSILDTVKIIVAGDTLVEVPVESWSAILPTNYIVQRNVGVVVPMKFAGNKVQAVFWDNDSVAQVLNLGSGTASWKYSGFIYTAYNDSQFKENGKLYDLFVRVKRNDSVVAYTEISEVTAKVGNLDFDSTQISETVNHIRYLYTFVPNDSSLKNWNDTLKKTLVIDTIFDTTHLEIDTAKYEYNGFYSDYGHNIRDTIYSYTPDTTIYNTADSVVEKKNLGFRLTLISQVDTISNLFVGDGFTGDYLQIMYFHYVVGENTFSNLDNLQKPKVVTNFKFIVRNSPITIKSCVLVSMTIIKHYI